MNIQLSFPLGAFQNTGDAFLFISKFISKPITVIRSPQTYSGGDWIEDYGKVGERLAIQNDKFFSIHDGEHIDSSITVSNWITFIREVIYEAEIFRISMVDESFINVDRLIEEASFLKFTTAQYYDLWKARWQTERFPNNFIASNKTYKDKKLIEHPYWYKTSGLTIDISQNPGRDMLTCNMHLMAAPTMWFGPGAWAYFDIDHILKCREISLVDEIFPGVLRVELFDPALEDYETPEILNKQREFRECSKMNEVEELLNSKLSFPQIY